MNVLMITGCAVRSRAVSPLADGGGRRWLHYWFDTSQPGLGSLSHNDQLRKTVGGKGEATFPNAQELPDTNFSYLRRMHELQMLTERRKAAAQSALLQFNVMVRQKVKPNVDTYTALILIMAKAKMELTAYKLFNRMLQQHILPMPETYQALLMATDPRRTDLLDDIRRKLYHSVKALPRTLATRQKQLLEETRSASKTYLTQLLEEDPKYGAVAIVEKEMERLAGVMQEVHDEGSSNATVYVDSLRKAFYGDKWVKAGKTSLTAEQKAALRPQLDLLNEHELRMYLAIHRKLRDGSKEDLIERIMEEIPVGFTYEMLNNRNEAIETMCEVLSANREVAQQVEATLQEPDEPDFEIVEETIVRNGRTKRRRYKRKARRANEGTKVQDDGSTDDSTGSVQEGIQLRGRYKVNYVQLASSGRLWSLSIKELKHFVQGEQFGHIGLTTGGTKSEIIAMIELYLFNKVSEATLAGVRPEKMHLFREPRLLQLHDKTDEQGREGPPSEAEERLEGGLRLQGKSLDSMTAYQISAPKGKTTRFKIPHVSGGREAFKANLVPRMRNTLTAKERAFLRRYIREKRQRLRDPALREVIENTEPHPDRTDRSWMLPRTLRSEFYALMQQRKEELNEVEQSLKPLRERALHKLEALKSASNRPLK
eukprot:Sspe_Gene.40527::Locus_19585_Transcript_1_1_Confidence_1.000_Length_2031::g.40527::m.40527